MKKAFIYIRVSTEEQAVEGMSLEAQSLKCNEWAGKNGYEIIGEFIDEAKSGSSITARKELLKMLNECKNKGTVEAVIVVDTDRFARNEEDHFFIKAILRKAEVKLISVNQPMLNETAEGKFLDTMLAGVNAYQSRLTGRKTSDTLEQKARVGWYPGGMPALGYKNAPNPIPQSTLDRKIIVVDNETAPIVKEVFTMYSTGNYNIYQITEYLNTKGIKSKTNSKIHSSLISRMLQDKFYIGEFKWNKKSYSGKHEQFISHELFNLVQNIIQAHNQNATRKRKHNFLLRGFVYCANCNRRIVGEQHIKKGSGKEYNQYFCPTCKTGTYVDREELQTQVETIFKKIQISKEYKKIILEKAEKIYTEEKASDSTERTRLEREKAKVEKAIKDTEDDRYLHRTITDETFFSMHSRYTQQKEGYIQALKDLDKGHAQSLKILEAIMSLAQNIGRTYKNAKPIQKQNYLGLFFDKFIVKDGKIIKYEIAKKIKPLIENGSVRIRTTGLPD